MLNFLESEAIHIFREVAAEAVNPVFLYSIGKDSSVMLHLALKAFYPAKPPFRFLHVDTNWKFQEMIKFRDLTMKQQELNLIVHKNKEGLKKNNHKKENHIEFYMATCKNPFPWILLVRGYAPRGMRQEIWDQIPENIFHPCTH